MSKSKTNATSSKPAATARKVTAPTTASTVRLAQKPQPAGAEVLPGAALQMEAKQADVKVEAKKADVKVEAKKADVKVEAKKTDVKVEAKKADVKIEAKKADAKVEAKQADAKVEAKKADAKVEVVAAPVVVEKPARLLSRSEFMEMVREEAYRRAERRQFQNGSPFEDWVNAEAAISGQLASQGVRLA